MQFKKNKNLLKKRINMKPSLSAQPNEDATDVIVANVMIRLCHDSK